MPKYDAVFFDLDGTLVDTAPDLAYALNQVLAEHHAPMLSLETIRPVASDGSPGLINLAFGISPDAPEYPAIQARFIELYRLHINRESRLFDGIENVLQTIEKSGSKWGVITNKPAFLTDPLMQALNLSQRASCIVSGDTTANSKPHPDPMLFACTASNVSPENCLYIGDAQRDIEAGNIVNMDTLIAHYGYLKSTDQPETWQAKATIYKPEEILNWI
ncbi:HAD family hydrolase [Methylophaga sulfidovorans]|uniref:Phosphoglycolate phosphatase n=1 Tax=Methylophaga sulfidovorans TaxID=45496 RepID=A0A1I3YDF7_9GAMM|nr:HAD-IA family hydrolase [Methylophaga sulfidovorans]SFK29904.1 phosphoglycolate phosphatase [Methylophaga sulfidovorans]